MDGPKPLLHQFLIASLALTSAATVLPAGEFIRQPSRIPQDSTRPADSTARPFSLSVSPARVTTPLSPSASTPVKAHMMSAPARKKTEPIRQPNASSDSVKKSQSQSQSQSQNQNQNQNQNTALDDSRQPGLRLVVEASPRDAEIASQSKSRKELAAKISDELLTVPYSDRSLSMPGSLEPAPGWQAVGEDLKAHLQKCEELLARNAYLSAREESYRAILQLVRVLDLRQNKFVCEPAWAQAQQALREAQDFTALERIANDSELFSRLIQSHETPVLRGVSVCDLTPLAAAQHYRAYAENCLVEASQGHPWFSELYYCIGRAHQAQSEAGDPQADALLQQALTYYRGAYAIQPTNATNANQLGYVLLRMDRASEAFAQLSEAVRLPTCPPEAWQNLVQASSRLGDQSTAQWAVQHYQALKLQGRESSAPKGTLVEVDPRQFAAMSPYASGPRAPANLVQSPQMPTPAQGQDQSPATRSAKAPKTGFFR